MNSTNSKHHDKKALKDFLMHVAGELRLQEYGLQGKPVPPKLQQGVAQFRTKYGSDLLPDAALLCFLANDPDDEGDVQRDAARQAMVNRRREQMKQVMGVIDLLGELEL